MAETPIDGEIFNSKTGQWEKMAGHRISPDRPLVGTKGGFKSLPGTIAKAKGGRAKIVALIVGGLFAAYEAVGALAQNLSHKEEEKKVQQINAIMDRFGVPDDRRNDVAKNYAKLPDNARAAYLDSLDEFLKEAHKNPAIKFEHAGTIPAGKLRREAHMKAQEAAIRAGDILVPMYDTGQYIKNLNPEPEKTTGPLADAVKAMMTPPKTHVASQNSAGPTGQAAAEFPKGATHSADSTGLSPEAKAKIAKQAIDLRENFHIGEGKKIVITASNELEAAAIKKELVKNLHAPREGNPNYRDFPEFAFATKIDSTQANRPQMITIQPTDDGLLYASLTSKSKSDVAATNPPTAAPIASTTPSPDIAASVAAEMAEAAARLSAQNTAAPTPSSPSSQVQAAPAAPAGNGSFAAYVANAERASAAPPLLPSRQIGRGYYPQEMRPVLVSSSVTSSGSGAFIGVHASAGLTGRPSFGWHHHHHR